MSLPIANWLQLTRYALGILIASSLSAQIRPSVRPDDLVLWFDFAELDGSTVKDLSANGLDGKTSGGPVLVDAPFGKALEFDGNGDKVTVEYDPSMDVSAYTVTLWLKSVKGNEGWAGVFGRPGRHYNFWAGDSNRDAWFIHHRYKDGSNGNAGAGDFRSLAHGEWVHVGLTNDGNSTSATYVNGELKTTGVVSNLTYSKNDLYIGANNDNGNGSWFEGFIDDVRLYKVALNAEEVALAYNNGEGDFNNLPVVTPVGESLVRIPLGGAYEEQGATAQDQEDGNISEITRTIYQPATKIDSNLAAWWKLDEYSGAEVNDSVLPGTVGVLKGDPLRMAGRLGWGLEVDGDDYVQADDFDGLKNTNSGTIAFWMRPTGGNYVFWADGLALIERQGTKLRLRWNLEGDWRNSHVTQPNSLPDGEWSHWIFSFNDGVTTLYKDGLSVFTGNDDQKSFSDRVVDVKFGWRDGYAGFQGRVDDLRIYKVALDDAAALLAYQGSGRLIAETVDASVLGDWTVNYLATDSAGASAEAKRTVRIFDPVAPVITLNGEAFIQHQVLTEYNDVGATVADADGNSLDSTGIKVDGIVDGGADGTYILAYNFTDAEGRSAETVFRTITVADNVPPVLTLHGKSEVRHLLGNPYVDAGASAEDAVDGVIFVDSSLYEWDKLHARGYMLASRPDSLMILDDNGGLLEAKPAGENAFDRRMEVNGDAAFNALGTGITINDNFQNLFTGVFRAGTAGTYEFGMPWPDDRGSFWLDLDQDGVFELDGTHGSEWMDGSIRFGYGQVQLQPGVYKVAIAHMESSHGSRLSAEFGLPGIVTPLANTETFDPVEALQVRFVVDKVNQHQPCIDELEIFSGGKNVALASLGSVATASSSANDATHNLNKVNDGLYGNSFSWRAHTSSAWVQIDLPKLMTIDRIVWSRDRIGRNGDRLPTDYRIDVMTEEGGQWVTIVEHKDRSVREIIHPGAVNQKGMWGIEKPMALDKTGSYEITYRAVDAAGNETTAKRTIVVVDSIDLPVITLLGEPRMEVSIRSEFTEPGYSVKSAFNEDLNANDVEVTGTVDTSTLGEHILTYEFVDADGIPAEVVHRTVVVVDREAPILTLLGDSEISLKLGENFNDPGVTVSDDSGAVLTAYSNLGFPREGLVLHLDASRLNLSDEEAFTVWPDLSGQFNDASAFAGEPTLALKALNGRPAVQIDGQDLIRTQKSFNNRYSIFSVSRLSGSSNERLISSATNNWILGYHSGYEDRMHADQWVYMSNVTATKEPHLYSAISLGDHNTRFYADTHEKVQYSSRNGQIGQLQFGGYQNGSQPGWGFIAEVLVYDHGVNADVRNSVETYLNAKYGLNGLDAPVPDLTTPGTYNLLYAARDASGNLGTTSRKIIITPDSDRPVVVLNGDTLIQHEAGTEFTDPGAKATDAEGNILEPDLQGEIRFPVGRWADLSGKGNHLLQTDSRYLPSFLSQGFQNLPALVFESSDTLEVPIAKDISSQGDFTVIAVHEFDNPLSGNWNTIVGIQNTDQAHGCLLLQRMDRAEQIGMHHANYNGNARVKINQLYGPRVSLLSRSEGNENGREGNVIVATNGYATSGQQTWDTEQPSSRLQVAGRQQGGTGYYSGTISEVIVLSFGISESDRHKVEGHLAHKWKLAGDLPEEHPHKVDAPEDWTPAQLSGLSGWYDAQKIDFGSQTGDSTVTYKYTDANGLSAEPVARTVSVLDTTPPVITLNGEAVIHVKVGDTLEHSGATATDLVDGEVFVTDDLGFPKTGLILDLNAASLKDSLGNGDKLTDAWPDASGFGNHMSNHDGPGPDWIEDGLNGEPILRFNGDTYMWNSRNFDNLTNGYTLFTISRYSGERMGRIFSSRSRNWLFGYHGGYTAAWYAEGWIVNTDNDRSKAWHLHSGTMGNQSDPEGSLWKDGIQKVFSGRGSNNSNFKPGLFAIGGWRNKGEQPSHAEVARILLFDRVLPEEDRQLVELFLNAKYSLNGLTPDDHIIGLDSSEPGTFVIRYTASDSSGNRSVATRTIHVVEDIDLPVLTLKGEAEVTLSVDDNFQEPGVVITDPAGSDPNALTIQGDIDSSKVGEYLLTYSYTSGGRIAEPVVRKVRVIDDEPPVFTLAGGDTIKLFIGKDFEEPGVTVSDNADDEIEYSTMPEGAAVYYSFNDAEAAGLDRSGNHANATLMAGAMGGGLGRYGHGLHIPQLPSACLDLGGNEVDLTEEWTIAVWFKNLYGAGKWKTLTRGSSRDHQLIVHVDNNQLGTFVNGRGDWRGSSFHIRPSETSQWSHIAAVGQGDRTYFYKDGAYATSSDRKSTTEVTKVGNWGADQHFAEYLDEFYVFKRALSEEELKGLPFSNTKIDTTSQGSWKTAYFATDSSGNSNVALRTIIVEPDPEAGIITLVGDAEITHEAGAPYEDAGVTLTTGSGQTLPTAFVQIAGVPDGSTLGTYSITYNYTSTSGTKAVEISRTVHVVDTTPPVITLVGGPIIHKKGSEFTDPGARAIDALDGEMRVIRAGVIPKEGLVLHLDAGQIEGLEEGSVVNSWSDLSPAGNDADNVKDNPTWHADVVGGRPVVRFDGGDLLWTTTDFSTTKEYSIISVARYTGGDSERVISSRGINWLFGFHGNTYRRWYANGWIWNQGGSDTSWHLHAGSIGEDALGTFWIDRELICSDKSGANPGSFSPGVIQLGGFNDNNELSRCEVAELLFYDRKLSEIELIAVQSLLDGKYGLDFGEITTATALDVNTPGIYTLEYITADKAGNTSTASRKVVVEEGSTLPVITLKGDVELTLEAGSSFEDPGVIVTDAGGNTLDASDVNISGQVDTSRPGIYNLTYDFISAERQRAISVQRKVTVVDTVAPSINLVGGETIRIPIGGEFIDPGASAIDLADGSVEVLTSLIQKNRILHRGFQQGWSDLRLYFHDNGGLFQDQPSGQNYLDGPLYFEGDASFRAAGVGIERNDQWQNLFTSTFNARVDGKYEFAITGRDDWATFWVDLDQDGTFERNGDFGSEWMNNGVIEGGSTVHLRIGYYKVAIGQMEGGGGSRIRASFRTPEGAGPALMATIDPTDPSQDGLWVEVTELNLSQAGEHSIEYTATDQAGNQTKAVRTLIVESVKGAPAIYLEGKRAITLAAGAEWKDPGATVEDKDGNVLDASSIVISGTVDSTVPGTYTLKYNFVDGDGIAAITAVRRVLVTDVVPPVLTLAGEAEMTVHLGSKWTDPGATATDNVDGAIPIMTSGIYPDRGLVLHLDASRIPLAKDGDPVSLWRDISGQGNHLDNNIGTGRYVASDTGGLPAVQFDGQTFLATTTSFGRRYTVASVARYDGNQNLRLIASRTHNWIFGYHNNHVNCFHPAGWVAGPDLWQPADTKPHLNIGTAGGGRCQFWGDGVDLTFIPNRTGDIGQFQLGGWQTTREAASGLVSEVLIYDRVLSYGEIDALQYYLNNKYGLQDDAPVRGPVDTSSEGDFEIRYAVVDSSGNRVTKTRTVQVILAPGSPVINMLGDPVVQHEAGIPYQDEGAALIDGDGNTLDPSLIEVVGTPSGNESGEYIITYNFQDSQGRPAVQRIRVVSVVDTTPPTITLLGDAVIKVEKDAIVEDPGATASDLVDGEFTLPDPLKYTAGALDVVGYMNQSNDALMNIDGNQGLLATDPVGESTIYSGTLELFNDGQFRAVVPSINRNDQYQVLFRGFFNAPTDGQYEFGNGDIDDRMAFWVDLDQDGIFEATGDLGSESFVSNWRNGYRNVNLSKGVYPVAILFMEYTGGARFQPSVQLPGGLRSVIHPAEQGRLWLASPSISIDTSTPGTYSYDYVVSDQAGNEARATRTVVVVEDASLPFIAIKGGFEVHHEAGSAFFDPGAKVTDMGGNILEADLKGEGTVDINTPGEYTLTYNYSDGAGRAASEVVRTIIVADTSAPTITLKPHPQGGLEKVTIIVGQIWEDPAATVTDSFDNEAGLITRPTDAVAYYSFDDTQEPGKDTSEGGQFPGRFIDGARWSADGRSGGSLHIPTPSANARMEIGPVDIGDAWTAAAWFKKLYASNWRTLFRGQANDHQIIIENGQTNLGLYDSAGGKGFQGTGFHMAASNYSGWHHIAAVGKDEQTLYYVDGDYVGKVDIQSKTDIWRVGAWPGQRFAEYLDDVYVFQRALSAGEVVALMSASNSTQVDTSVPGEYKVYYHAMDAAGNVTENVRIVEVIPDPAAPLLKLNGHANIYHEAGTEFTDPGATVNLPDGTLVNANLPGVGEVDTRTLGSYSISYTYRSGDGKTALPLERTVTVRDTTAPVITLNGAETVVVALGDTFVEPGYSALDSLDGEVPTESSAEFPKVGLMLDLDATFYEGKLEDGDLVTTPWLDVSGRNHHMNLFNGSGITWHADALNGEPVLRFDGQSLMWTTKNFDDHKEGYTVLTVARYIDGTKRRIISSRSRNWLFGFHGGNSASWHPEGWVYNSDTGGDIDWHIHAGTVNNDADPAATFWKDGVLRITGNRSFNNVWNKPGQIAAGGNWGERSNCEVARILLYDRELSKESVETAMRALQSHYSLHGRTKEDKLLDTSQIGEHIVTYQTEDAAGNIATATRTVIVQDNPPIPEIVLQPGSDGEIDLVWEAGTPFVEPGFKLYNRYDKEIEANAVEVEGTVNHFTLGTYRITYSYTDEKGNPATRRERAIRVVDTTPPVITLVGGETITFEVGKPFEDPGYTAVDALDGNVTAKVSLKGRPEGLIANWTFDDGTGDKVTESISNIHATLKNFQEPNQAWQDGKFGKSIKLDGIDDYILVPGASKLDLQKMTISMWIKASDYAQDGFLFEKTANGSVNTQYSIYFEASDELNYRLVQGGNLNDTRIPSNANFEFDEWTHLAVTYDGTLKSIYVGGELVTAMPAIVPINMGPGGVSTIGANGAGNDYFFDGFIDEIQIYKRAVPEDQIHALMSTAGIDTSQKSVQPYTLVYTATDSSGNSSIAERKIIVSNDVTPPVITLIGDTEVFVDVGSVYEDFGATALDDTDGNLTPFIDDGGSLDEVDTSEPGEFIIKYDVEDFSGNKAVQVTRKVIVQSSDPFNKWAQANGLSQLSVEDRAPVADPDHDGVPNLLEYALGGDPVRSNRAILPTFDNSGDNIKIFFYRIKATVDSTLDLSVQLTSDLGNAAAWDDSQVELRGALNGVPQTDLPDGKPFATSRFERFEARAKTSKADAGGKQFIRIFIEKN